MKAEIRTWIDPWIGKLSCWPKSAIPYRKERNPLRKTKKLQALPGDDIASFVGQGWRVVVGRRHVQLAQQVMTEKERKTKLRRVHRKVRKRRRRG